jgi:hypothetical protein
MPPQRGDERASESAIAAANAAATLAASVTLAGCLLSGPISLALVRLHPQPSWQGAEAFARAYHPLQTIPYFTGFFLVGGALALIAALHALAPPALRARSGAALGFAAAFAALITFNYVVQTTFVPALARAYVPDSAPIIAAFSLSNPRSLGWGLEMWGYAVLGVATWLIAPVFLDGARSSLGRATAALFVANGPVSLVGGVWTALEPGWVMTSKGIALFALWNLLVVAMLVLAIATLRARDRGTLSAPLRAS